MGNAVLISIRPEWVEKILSGEKTLEVRKTRPKLETPFKCYIYCTKDAKDSDRLWVLNEQQRKEYGGLSAVCANLEDRPDYHSMGNGKVVGEFVCDKIANVNGAALPDVPEFVFYKSCLCFYQLDNYLDGKEGYAWHISNLKVYDIPIPLSWFVFPPELYCEKELCGGCPLDQSPDVNGEYEFDCEWRRPLRRPPQSWCYVEELENGKYKPRKAAEGIHCAKLF